jgi:hypothetical protein
MIQIVATANIRKQVEVVCRRSGSIGSRTGSGRTEEVSGNTPCGERCKVQPTSGSRSMLFAHARAAAIAGQLLGRKVQRIFHLLPLAASPAALQHS